MGRDHRRAQADRPGSKGVAPQRCLRSRADVEFARRHVGHQWDQCHGPCGGGALRSRCHTDHLVDGRRRSARAGCGLTSHRRRQRGRRWSPSGALWGVAVRSHSGRDDDVAAPQAVPCARRNAQPSPLRHPQRRPSLRVGVQRAIAPAAAAVLSRALGVSRARRTGCGICRGKWAPHSLAELGMQESDVERITEEVTSRSYGNPRPITRDSVRGLLSAAWAGQWPVSDGSAAH